MNVPGVDRDLLERARAGDSRAFGELIRPHVPSVRRFAYAFARRWSDADDLAQEALLKAFRSMPSYEGRAALGTWLYSVTRSVCYDHYRSSLAHARNAEDPLDEVAEVEAFIDGLPEDPRCEGAGVSRRTVLVPAPTLGSRWAASAWGFALTADCFDSEAFRAFYDEHYGLGPEDLCNPPAQPLTADPCL